MSPKELLYIEDALGHENCLKALCTERADRLGDDKLRRLASELAGGHAQRFDFVLSLLN